MPHSIFITGGAGYIGSVLIPRLLAQGHRVTCLDNLMYNQATLIDCCGSDNFNFIRGDARDERIIAEQVPKHDIIFPLACLTGAPLCEKDPLTARSVMAEAIGTLLKYRSVSQLIIYPNTNSGYGIGEKSAFCTEESPLRPISLYGRLKVEGEQMILEHGNAVSFRLATVFGPSSRMRVDLLVNDFVYRALNDRYVVLFQADAKRNYIHIRDVVGAFIHAFENWNAFKNNVFNLGLSGANLSKRELCEKIQEHVPSFYFTIAEIGDDPDKRDYIVSNEKLEKRGYKPSISIDAGIIELMKVFSILRIKRSEFVNFQ